ncbi:hypothetical protein [Agromyces sp. Marseille-P2726]|uniref:hypothetical protein n=1 Tax=Agromyces sp. Marseille-P2726 TaxID=2709132 RepID=UPI0020C323E4|nr:hypothetical protein [Agromyces sp. Marseille-P2726]
MEVVSRHPSRTAQPEYRWPAVVALLAALALYAFLPNELVGGQRFVVVAAGAALLISLSVVNPHRLRRQTKWSRMLSVGFALVLVLVNQITLVILVVKLVAGRQDAPGLLLAALQVWVANVIGFALLYWELDRGGPVVRTSWARTELPPADLRFSQDEDADTIEEVAKGSAERMDWTPQFIDYLYTSLSNSMAFSASDAMPLRHRMKVLMGLQAFGGFVILALVIARSVGILD